MNARDARGREAVNAVDASGRLTPEAFSALCECDSIQGTTLKCDASCAAYAPCFLSADANDPILALFKAERAAVEMATDSEHLELMEAVIRCIDPSGAIVLADMEKAWRALIDYRASRSQS